MLLVLVSHDVQDGISYDFDGLSTLSCLPSYTSGGCSKLVIAVSYKVISNFFCIVHVDCAISTALIKGLRQ